MKLLGILLLVQLVALAVAGPIQPAPFSSLSENDELSRSLKAAESLLVSSLVQGVRHVDAAQSGDIHLQDVFFNINDDTSIELTNLRLQSVSAFDLPSIKPDLTYMNMELAVKMGNLSVKGDFKVVNRGLLKVLPITNAGQLSMFLIGVHANGRVGLQVGDISLSTHNLDLAYSHQKVKIMVTYPSNEGPDFSQVAADLLDQTLAFKLRRDLRFQLNLILQRELNQILEHAPVSRLLQDNPALVTEYRSHARATAAVANSYVDDVLKNAKKLVEADNLQQIGIPQLHETFSKEVMWVTWHGSFKASKGWARNLATLKRTSDVSLSYNNGAITVFGSIGLSELKAGFDYYRAEFMDMGPSGSVRANVGRNSVYLKVTVTVGTSPTARLDNLNVENLSGIDIDVTGLGVLDWLTSKVATWVTEFLHDEIVELVDNKLRSAVRDILDNVSPNDYFL